MPKRISVRVPEPDEVDLDVTPTELLVSGEYGAWVSTETVTFDGEFWRLSSLDHQPFTSRDEALDAAGREVRARITRNIAHARVEGILA